uniref:hypothetical protein n=1 Tax=Pseudomonas aeruginosa TaxID=287 RepID=UPI001968D43B
GLGDVYKRHTQKEQESTLHIEHQYKQTLALSKTFLLQQLDLWTVPGIGDMKCIQKIRKEINN